MDIPDFEITLFKRQIIICYNEGENEKKPRPVYNIRVLTIYIILGGFSLSFLVFIIIIIIFFFFKCILTLINKYIINNAYNEVKQSCLFNVQDEPADGVLRLNRPSQWRSRAASGGLPRGEPTYYTLPPVDLCQRRFLH